MLGIVGLGLSLPQGVSSWRLDPPSVHIEVERGKTLEYRVQIANPGATELRVTDAVASSTYVSARVETPRIPPGGFGGVFLRAEGASLPDEFEVRIEVCTDDPAVPTRTFVLTGRKIDPLPPPPPEAAPTVPGVDPAAGGSPSPGATLPGATTPGSDPSAPSSPSRESSSSASPLLAIVLAGAAGLVLAYALWRRRKAT